MTFNRFAGLGTLHALRTLVFARAPLGCDVSRAGNGMSAMRVLRFASAARAGSVSRPSSLWRPTKCVWMFGRRVKGGVEPLALWQAVRQGALGRRRTFDRLGDQFLPGTYEPPDFTLRLAHKDVTLATELARELRVPMRVADLALEELTEALNRGR